MSRFRLKPTPQQEATLLAHCAHARFVWNLAVEQHQHWRVGRQHAPGFVEHCRQLTEARAQFEWLAAGSATVQQQALRDFAQAMTNFFRKTHGRPTWRKAGRREGFRIVGLKVGSIRRLSRNVGEVSVPKVGWVRFRWSRALAAEPKSYRITRDSAGRWHIAFALIPGPVAGPGTGETVGVDRGVVVSAALSTGEMLKLPTLREHERKRLMCLQRRLTRAKPGSARRAKVQLAIGRLRMREIDRRNDQIEKFTTRLAETFDAIVVEDLKIRSMTRSAKGTLKQPGRGVRQKARLNSAILSSGWGHLVERLEHKAPGRVVKVNPRFTSQTCNACGKVAAESRESQSRFVCVGCGHSAHADVHAARNIRDSAPGRGVAARGGQPLGGPLNREPQLQLAAIRGSQLESPGGYTKEDVNPELPVLPDHLPKV